MIIGAFIKLNDRSQSFQLVSINQREKKPLQMFKTKHIYPAYRLYRRQAVRMVCVILDMVRL